MFPGYIGEVPVGVPVGGATIVAPAPVFGQSPAPVYGPQGPAYGPPMVGTPVAPSAPSKIPARGRIVASSADHSLARFTGEVAYGAAPVPGGGWSAVLYLPLPSVDGSGVSAYHLELSAYIPPGWENELRAASQRAMQRAAVSGPGDTSLVWLPCCGSMAPLPRDAEIGFVETLLSLLPAVGPLLGGLLGGGQQQQPQQQQPQGGAAGGLQGLQGLLGGLLGNILGGAQGGSQGAAALATGDVLSQALQSLAPQLFGASVGPLAELLRGATRGAEAQLRASTGDPQAREWMSYAIRAAEGRIADSLRLASTLMGLTTPIAP